MALIAGSVTAHLSVALPAQAWDGPMCALDADGSAALPIAAPQVVETVSSIFSEPSRPLVASAAPTVLMCPPADGAAPERLEVDLHPGVLNLDEAREAMAEARTLLEAGDAERALLQLGVVERAYPNLADRVALQMGEIHLAAERPGPACEAFDRAIGSIDTAVHARARVGKVRCLLLGDDAEGESELGALMRFYPRLPEAAVLRFELGRSKERRGDVNGAVRIFRQLDIERPGSPIAAEARGRMGAIAESGVAVRALTGEQRVLRLETLARQGPHAMAREECEALLETRMLPAHRSRVNLVAARIARIEGRWEDARRYLQQGGAGNGAQGNEDREREVERIHDAVRAAQSREQQLAVQRVNQLRGSQVWRAVPHQRLLRVIQTAARAGLKEPVDEALAVLASSGRTHPAIAFEAALIGSGIGEDEHVAALYEKVIALPGSGARGVAARYHYARTLERLGRFAEAEVQYLRVAEIDQSETGWYAMWSQQRLWSVRAGMLGGEEPSEAVAEESPVPEAVEAPVVELAPPQPLVPVEGESVPIEETAEPVAALGGVVDTAEHDGPRKEGTRAADSVGAGTVPPVDLDQVIAELELLIASNGEGYPWFERARDLLVLGEKEAATDELHEAYLAYRDAFGRPLRRAGLEAVFRGEEAPRRPMSAEARRLRRQLGPEAKQRFIEVASALGDEGTAVGLSGWSRAQLRPRAYSEAVHRAARNHGLDPNLLFAVMRVESVYQRRIVSYAGAVGLMQIMPRTGRHIADAVGDEDFTVDDLLDPRVNLEFAAWYLASLIERFDGRLPLAIASYNGGPHNVRRWLRDYGEGMPLDAFLEKIPFEQTHRYVRRVLGHYAAYRGQEGLPMERLSTVLPQVEADPLAF
ncbi:MAG: transglycosylase SLT domain-containing protein [Myxococcota bacterium]